MCSMLNSVVLVSHLVIKPLSGMTAHLPQVWRSSLPHRFSVLPSALS